MSLTVPDFGLWLEAFMRRSRHRADDLGVRNTPHRLRASTVCPRRWHAVAAGFQCTIEQQTGGTWTVTLASASIARGRDLESVIFEAGGGLVDRVEADSLAATVTSLAAR
jgi:hypothetical protein